MKNIFFSLLAVLLFISGAYAQVTDAIPPSYRTEGQNPIDIYRASAEKINDLVHTRLDLSFDYENQEVNGEAILTLSPRFYETDELTLDAQAMLIHEVELQSGNSKKKLNFKYENDKIKINLDKKYNRNQEYTIVIKYTARPNEVTAKGSSAISDAKGIYFINPKGEETDKPIQIWTQGEPTASSAWFPTIDEPGQKTSQEIYMRVPDQYVTLSNGKLEKQTNNNDGTRTDYWNFKEKHAPYLFFLGVGDFAIVKDNWRGKEVSYYVEKEYEPYARQIFGDTPEMMEFFSTLLDYPYPWNKYSQMVGRDYVSGAMENTTAVLHLERAQQKPGQLIDENIWEGTIAHELFHHWFGNLVTMESFANISVNESFANYSEYLWNEYKYGKERADEDRYEDLDRYFSDPTLSTKDLVRVHYKELQDIFDHVSYNKGGKGVLHMLRNYLGDEAFFAGLNKYLTDNAYGTGEADQLRIALEEVSGRDLNWFFDQWFFGSGHPELNIGYEYNPASKKVKVMAVQTSQNLFEFPFTFDVIVDGVTKRHQVWVSKTKNNVFEFDAAKKPDVVIPNSDQTLLVEINDNKSIEEFTAQYKNGNGEYITRILALEKMKDAQSVDANAAATLISALDDPYEGIRERAVYMLDASNPQIKEKARPTLVRLASSDPKTLVQRAALEKLNEMGETDISVFKNALNSPSFSVQAIGAAGVLRLDPTRIEELKSLDLDVIQSNELLIGAMADTWVTENDISKLSVMADAAAFYFFTKFDNPELGAQLERGFNWVLSADDMKSTKKVSEAYKSVYRYYGKENTGLSNILNNMLDQAINLKTKANLSNPSKGYEEQIELLTETKNSLK